MSGKKLVRVRAAVCVQPIAAVVVGVDSVALGPEPGGAMEAVQLVELHPEPGVANGPSLFPPMAALPVSDPDGTALADILGVGRDFDFAGLFER